jgi:hypothetical protein
VELKSACSQQLRLLVGACRAQSDKIFSQQSALGKANEELKLLREQLESRQAQQAVIEAEINRQVMLAVHKSGSRLRLDWKELNQPHSRAASSATQLSRIQLGLQQHALPLCRCARWLCIGMHQPNSLV